MKVDRGARLLLGMLGILVTASLWGLPTLAAETKVEPVARRAPEVYHNYCAPCHGEDGKGRGNLTAPSNWREINAANHRRMPRDFTRDWFRFGDHKEDIEVTISRGSYGTAMEGFRRELTPEVRSALADLILKLRGATSNALIEKKFPGRIPDSTEESTFHHLPQSR